MRNTYEALDDASVSVMFALSELHDQFGCECFSNSPPCPRHVAPVSLPEPLQLLPAHFPPHHVYYTHCAGMPQITEITSQIKRLASSTSPALAGVEAIRTLG